MSGSLQDGNTITYPRLVEFRLRGLRNGNWRHLNTTDRALFRCAFWVAKVRGKISNTKLVTQVLEIAVKLVEGVRGAILSVGRRRTGLMLKAYEKPLGVFSWAPQVREWLSDSDYVWYLGVLGVNT
jgi:hypothetical protein